MSRKLLAVAVGIAAVGVGLAPPAAADPGIYAQWTMDGAGGAYSGTMTVPTPNFPAATWTSDAPAPPPPTHPAPVPDQALSKPAHPAPRPGHRTLPATGSPVARDALLAAGLLAVGSVAVGAANLRRRRAAR